MLSESPEGAYGWAIVGFAFLSQAMQVGITWATGVFYVLFLHNINSNKAVLAFISASNTSIFYLTGPVAAYFTNRFGCRPVHMVGGVIGCTGLVLSGFANNPYHLGFTFGLMTGVGLGLCFIPSLNIISMYFNKRRNLAMGLAISGAGMGTLVFPAIIRMFFNEYGYQGALILTGGISLNLVVCGAMFKPLPEKSPARKDPLEKVGSESKENPTTLFHCNIFQDITFILLCINNFCTMFGLSVIYVHFAAYAATLGYSETSCAMLYSGMGISNFVGRLIYSFMGISPKMKPVHFYTGVYFFSGIATLIVPFVKAYSALMVFSVCYGLYSAIFCITLPLFIVDCLSVDMLPSGYGYILIFEAVGQVIGGPVAGLLYNYTGYYGSSLFLGGGVTLLGGIIMLQPCIKLTRRDMKETSSISIEET